MKDIIAKTIIISVLAIAFAGCMITADDCGDCCDSCTPKAVQ